MSNYAEQEITSNSKFLKIEEGKPQQIRLLGDSAKKIIHGFGKSAAPCTGEDCVLCPSDPKGPQERFKANCYCHTQQKVMLFEYGAGVAKLFKKIAKELLDEHIDICDVDLKISAEGSGLQKKYTVIPWNPPKALPTGLKLFPLTEDVPF